jgi:hypothetical protein
LVDGDDDDPIDFTWKKRQRRRRECRPPAGGADPIIKLG